LVNFYQTTRCYNPEDSNLLLICFVNKVYWLKSICPDWGFCGSPEFLQVNSGREATLNSATAASFHNPCNSLFTNHPIIRFYIVWEVESVSRTNKIDAFILYFILLYSELTDKVESNCHFPALGWNCMTHRKALHGFPDTSQVSLHKTIKSTYQYYNSSSCREAECEVAFNFISGHTVFCLILYESLLC
jgi:hypothetical protein